LHAATSTSSSSKGLPEPIIEAYENPIAISKADAIIIVLPCPTTIKEVHHYGDIIFNGLVRAKGSRIIPIIDIMNPLVNLHISEEFRKTNTSITEELENYFMEQVQLHPITVQWKLYKALNTIGAHFFGNPPSQDSIQLDNFYAGGDGNNTGQLHSHKGHTKIFEHHSSSQSTKHQLTFGIVSDSEKIVQQIIYDLGFHPRGVGDLRYARNLESLAELWINLAYNPQSQLEGKKFGFTIIMEEKE